MIFNDEHGFFGVTLDDDQRIRLKNYTYAVLGDKYYNLVDEFFTSVWESSARYKVFLARRCLNLMYLMYRIKHESPCEFQRSFYSDGAILANASEIADSYITWGIIPEIMIVDDILLHGRTLNALIDNLIDAVYKCIEDKGYCVEKSEIEYEILNSLTIRVMVQNSKPLLIRSRYYQRLNGKLDMSDVWSPRDWHDLSFRISRLIAEGFFCNTSFVLSLYGSEKDDFHNKFAKAASDEKFSCSKWHQRFVRDVWVKELKNDNGDVVALYTLRITQNAVDKNYRIVPFVMLADFDYKSNAFDELFNKYFDINAILPGRERLKAEAIYLILSHGLLLLLQNRIGEKLICKEKLDIDKINFSFRTGGLFNGDQSLNEIAKSDNIFIDWDDMNQHILDATQHSEPLIRAQDYQEAIKTDYQDILEEILATEGEGIEENAFWEYSKKIKVSNNSRKKPIRTLFSKVLSNSDLNHGKNCGIANLVGSLLRFMDIGIVAVGARNIISDNKNVISCVYRAGEQSQFIHPKKHSKEFPTLVQMEKDCLSNITEINKRIEKMYCNNNGKIKQLKDLVKMLYNSGQRLYDWDINFLSWYEIPIEKSIDGRFDYDLLTQIVLAAAERNSELDRYQQMYPGKN